MVYWTRSQRVKILLAKNFAFIPGKMIWSGKFFTYFTRGESDYFMRVIRHEIRAEELKTFGTVVGDYKAVDHWAFSLCHYQDRLFFLTGGIKKVWNKESI